MELQAMFLEAMSQADEEEIKKGRLYGGLKPHLKSAMTFCCKMANEGKDLTYHQLLKIARHTEIDYRPNDSHKHQEDKSRNHNSVAKLNNDFGSKPTVRNMQAYWLWWLRGRKKSFSIWGWLWGWYLWGQSDESWFVLWKRTSTLLQVWKDRTLC